MTRRQISSISRTVVVAIALGAAAKGQAFQFAPGQIPQGNPFNNSSSEAVDFADVDLDGDMDWATADGGDCCNDQNRLWINLGFAQGGSLGFFADETATRFPAVLDDSRDMDFVDFDGDGDQDLFTSNTATITLQSSRFWANMGGLQSGAVGFFQDQTAQRWLDLGVNNGTTECSSVAQSMVLGSDGFINWSCDSVFGDLDNDGDADLLHATYGPNFNGQVPQRVFLNDGQGNFKEHNPSCYQLEAGAIPEGAPALWAQGLQRNNTTDSTGIFADVNNSPLGVELGDVDADFDVDFWIGSRNNPPPRLFRNMRDGSGPLIWRDVTAAQVINPATGSDNYEQEFGDMDNDGDYDLLGVNYPGLNDAVFANNAGTFTGATTLPASGADDNEGEWFDFNNDGNLDIFMANFSGQDRLYMNNGMGNFEQVPLPTDGSTSLHVDSCDVDLDGDYDLAVSNDGSQANVLLKNITQVADTRPASLPHLEQVPNRPAGSPPSIVRVHVYDNASWDVARYNLVELEYQHDGGPSVFVTMQHAGGQLFRGQIPGTLVGTVTYRVHSTDEHGNSSVSQQRSYVGFLSNCTGNVVTYCSAKVTSSGCVPQISGVGNPSFFAPQVFTITAATLEPNFNGILFFGLAGPANTPFQGGFLCVSGTLNRLKIKNSGGSGACNGALIYKLTELMEHPTAGQSLIQGQQVNVQGWFRDPPAATMTGLTDGLQFEVCP